MKTLILTSAAIIAFGGSAVQAQMQGGNTTTGTMTQGQAPMQGQMNTQNQMPQMTAEQQSVYNGLNAEQKSSFDSWDLQQKGLYFALNEQQRGQLWALPAAQRAQAWQQIRTAAGLPATAPTTGTSGSMNGMNNNAMNNNARTGAATAGNMPNNSTLPVRNGNGVDAAVKADYPVCSATVADSCINPRAAR